MQITKNLHSNNNANADYQEKWKLFVSSLNWEIKQITRTLLLNYLITNRCKIRYAKSTFIKNKTSIVTQLKNFWGDSHKTGIEAAFTKSDSNYIQLLKKKKKTIKKTDQNLEERSKALIDKFEMWK